MPNKQKQNPNRLSIISLMYNGAGKEYSSPMDIDTLKENFRNNISAVGFWQGTVYDEYDRPAFVTICPLVCNISLIDGKIE